MSSAVVLEPPAKPETRNNHHSNKSHVKVANNNLTKRKNKFDRGPRKRSKSFSGCGIPMNQKPVLPTKFLLGGNINDPLNLNSLQDEEINRAMNAVTPKSSPIPTPPRRKGPIEVMIPPNTHDPLHLIDCADDAEYEQQLCSPVKKGRKKRLKKRRTCSASVECSDTDLANASTEISIAKTPEASTDSAKIPDVPQPELPDPASTETKLKLCRDLTIEIGPKKEKKRKSEEYSQTSKKFKNSMDKIVSPVVPQPGAWLKRSNSVNKWAKPRQNKVNDEQMPLFKEQNKRYQYGNFNRYYGYRNPNNEVDHRLRVFSHHPYLFVNKDILDIGCNIGHITLSVARDFGAKSILGIDIDPKLITVARKNVKHYVKTAENSPRPEEDVDSNNKLKSSEFFPISMPILYGAIDIPGFHDTDHKGRGFPNNVTFKQCNYVLEDENLLSFEQPQFDVILCLSITKWIHLNWGDSGLKLAFRRMYEQLRPGGKLILEPQYWAGYKSKKKLTETIYKNYNAIDFFPDKFSEYLLSPAVGFAKSEILGYPAHKAAGFRRPIQVFTKSTMFPSERVEITPSSGGGYSDPIYRKLLKTEKHESRKESDQCVEHVYTDLLQSGYCANSNEANDINNSTGEELEEISDLAEGSRSKIQSPPEKKVLIDHSTSKSIQSGGNPKMSVDNT